MPQREPRWCMCPQRCCTHLHTHVHCTSLNKTFYSLDACFLYISHLSLSHHTATVLRELHNIHPILGLWITQLRRELALIPWPMRNKQLPHQAWTHGSVISAHEVLRRIQKMHVQTHAQNEFCFASPICCPSAPTLILQGEASFSLLAPNRQTQSLKKPVSKLILSA